LTALRAPAFGQAQGPEPAKEKDYASAKRNLSMNPAKERSAPDECANCGASIPRDARSCPECGADERTGWRETSLYDNLDLPEEAWQEEGSAQTPPARQAPRINGVAWYWWCAGALLIVLLIAGVMSG